MTTVSMDITTTEKFFLASFVWCVSPINSTPADARHGDSWTR